MNHRVDTYTLTRFAGTLQSVHYVEGSNYITPEMNGCFLIWKTTPTKVHWYTLRTRVASLAVASYTWPMKLTVMHINEEHKESKYLNGC